MQEPTAQELFEASCDDHEDIVSVHREVDDSWRHGVRVYEVFRRKSDDTYWATNYEQSTDGEYNGLLEETHSVEQVTPRVEIVEKTIYEKVGP